MKTLELKIYDFQELTKEAKEKAIENYREKLYEYNDFAQWAIDDCSLLEPQNKELENLFGKNYNFPLLENNRKIYFSLDRNRYIDISNAIIVNNEYQFLLWLGIPEKMIENVYFKIGEDTIEFEENDYQHEFTEKENEILKNAIEKFENHCENILDRIEKDIDYRFSDEAIIEELEINSFEFLENGEIY